MTEWAGRRVLVTGGAGFIGSHLIESLAGRGARVDALDLVAQPVRLAGVASDIRYLCADLAAWEPEGAQAYEYVFHLAGWSMLTGAQKAPEMVYRWNVMATANLLRLARAWPIQKLVFTSAGGLYTNTPKYLPIDERHPIDPAQGVYVTTKRLGELLCEEFHRQYGLPVLYVRLFNTYGPRQATDFLIPSLIHEGMTMGTVTVRSEQVKRDFTFVGDMVAALIAGAESSYCGGPVNLGTGAEHSLGEVARNIGVLLGVKVECLDQPAFGPMRQVCDRALAQRILGWQPTTTLPEGLALTVRSFTEGRHACLA